MWILECDGDLFGGCRKWLKPGQKYLFGRTKPDPSPDEQFYAITNKSVSRKHLVISVAPVPRGQGHNLYERSEVTITDESKLGTQLDGERFSNESRTVSDKQHSIRLGSYDQRFRLSWQPVVLTFAYTSRELQRVQNLRNELEHFDIKMNTTYLSLDTTHVVTSKRNVPKSLQALIHGRYIVTEQFIHALIKACTSPNGSNDGSILLPSLLEEDVDKNWPDTLAFLPPPGKEPHQRSESAFAPNPNRINVFEGFTFIFADEAQFETVSPVVMSGGAKAVKYDLRPGETRLEDFILFVREVAQQRGINDILNNQTPHKVVVVRFQCKGSMEQWGINFIQNLDSQLGLRSIGQNEFLDAILMNDASPLHRVLRESSQPPREADTTNPEHNETHGEIQRDQQISPDKEPDEQSQAQLQSPEHDTKSKAAVFRTRPRRGVAESRFKGFDDFDPSQISKSNRRNSSAKPEDEDGNPRNESEMQSGSNTLFVGDDPSDRNTRKRARSDNAQQTADGDAYESLFPAASEMKRRRIGEGQLSPSKAGVDESDQHSQSNGGSKTTTRSSAREVDVKKAAQSRAKKLDEERAAKEKLSFGSGHDEDKEKGMEYDEDISKLRNLAIEEEMEILPRQRGNQHTTLSSENGQGAEDGQWDDRWNGMKNFKKFRRNRNREEDETPANRGRRVLVNLVEVKQKDFGIGDNYWLEPSSASTSRRERSSGTNMTTSQSQARNRTQIGQESSTPAAPGGRSEGPRGEIGEDEEEILPEEIAGQPREEHVANALAKQQSQKAVSGQGTRKRPADSAPTPPASKRTRGAASARQEVNLIEDSDSDDDELKFRFRRRQR